MFINKQFLTKSIIITIVLFALLIIVFFTLKNLSPIPMQNIYFDLYQEKISFNIRITNNIKNEYKSKARVLSYSGQQPDNWKQLFYNIFLEDDSNLKMLYELLDKLKDISEDSKLELPEVITAYVQDGINYDYSKLSSDTRNTQYPVETIFLKKGVCADKSILLAKLLILADYKVVLFSFDDMNHMAVGINVPKEYGDFNTNYCYIETTNISPIGHIPEKMNGKIFNEYPEILYPKINGHKTFMGIMGLYKKYKNLTERYGKDYLFCSNNKKRILIKFKRKKELIDSLKEIFNKDCHGNLSRSQYEKCKSLQKKINREVEEYNLLVKQYNKQNNEGLVH